MIRFLTILCLLVSITLGGLLIAERFQSITITFNAKDTK